MCLLPGRCQFVRRIGSQGEFVNGISYLDDDPRCIACWNKSRTMRQGVPSGWNRYVTIVERNRLHSYDDFSRAGCRHGFVMEIEVIQTSEIIESIALQPDFFFKTACLRSR